MSRRTVSPKARFEIFKRDEFTCQYCGRKTPDAVLEIDHIIPVAEGGENDEKNLVTSCWECNRGKGAALLSDGAPVSDIHEQTVYLLERELQLREYNHIAQLKREREDSDIQELMEYWDELSGYTEAFKHPDSSTVRRFLQILAVSDIKDAMEIAADRVGCASKGVSYLIGILKNKESDMTDAASR